MHILIMTVGTGRNRQDIANALLFSIQRHKPQRVVFLCSEKTARETLPPLEDSLRTMDLTWESVVTQDENNVQSLYNSYLQRLRAFAPQDLIVDFTSGTKAMSAALFAAAVAVEAGKVSYITGPRDETGRVIESTDLEDFYPICVYAERQLERARLLFNKLDFVAAMELTDTLRRILPDNLLKQQAKTIWMISQAYDLWERFRWEQAAHVLNKAANPYENLVGVDLSRLANQTEFLQRLLQEEWGTPRLVELLLNAQRRFIQGRLDDALSRMYRAYEYLAQVYLRKRGLDTSKIKIEELKKMGVSAMTLERLAVKPKHSNGCVKLGLKEAIELLAELKDEIGLQLIKLYWNCPFDPNNPPKDSKCSGPLKNWLESRNNSFLAHGSVPIEEQTVKGLLNTYDALLAQCIPSQEYEQMKTNGTFITL